MKSKAKMGLKQILREASSKLDPAQKQQVDRLGEALLHAIAIKDTKAAEKAVAALARVFLKNSTVSVDP